MRNITGREDSITCRRTNELAHTLLTDYTHQLRKLYGRLDGTQQHYAILPGSTASVHKPIHSKITLTYLLGRLVTAQRMAVKALLNAKRSPFTGFAQAFSVLIVRKSRLLLLKKHTHSYVYCRLCNMRGHINNQITYVQLSPLYFLSILYITHMINYSRASPLFCTTSDGSWAGPGNKAKTTAKYVGIQ